MQKGILPFGQVVQTAVLAGMFRANPHLLIMVAGIPMRLQT